MLLAASVSLGISRECPIRYLSKSAMHRQSVPPFLHRCHYFGQSLRYGTESQPHRVASSPTLVEVLGYDLFPRRL